jgi:predicted pyridoxine 5'-phosphate oxidase superfamily flavin-nucleotide-binding protein
MAQGYLETAVTPAVCRAQEHYYGRSFGPASTADPTADQPPTPLGPEEQSFIAARDSFYLASVSETGWPYVQHRGGPVGFLQVVGPHTLSFPDYRGNRQLLSVGHVSGGNDRVALFLINYPRRERLKILGHARVEDVRAQHAQVGNSTTVSGKVERQFLIEVQAFDWNCSQFITPRYTEAEVQSAHHIYEQRILELEAQLAAVTPAVRDARRPC